MFIIWVFTHNAGILKYIYNQHHLLYMLYKVVVRFIYYFDKHPPSCYLGISTHNIGI